MKLKKNRITISLLTITACCSVGIILSTVAWFRAGPVINTPVNSSLADLKTYFDDEHQGSGSSDDPFIITRPIHLHNLMRLYNDSEAYALLEGKYIQIGIEQDGVYKVHDYNGNTDTTTWSTELDMSYYQNDFRPIGYTENKRPFASFLEGNDITIKNLHIKDNSDTTRTNFGVFGYITTGTISNIKFSNLNVYPTQDTYVGFYAGGVNDDSCISGCSVLDSYIKPSSTANSDFGYIGRIKGKSLKKNGSSVKMTMSASDITAHNTFNTYQNYTLMTSSDYTHSDPSIDSGKLFSSAVDGSGNLKEGNTLSTIGYKDSVDSLIYSSDNDSTKITTDAATGITDKTSEASFDPNGQPVGKYIYKDASNNYKYADVQYQKSNAGNYNRFLISTKISGNTYYLKYSSINSNNGSIGLDNPGSIPSGEEYQFSFINVDNTSGVTNVSNASITAQIYNPNSGMYLYENSGSLSFKHHTVANGTPTSYSISDGTLKTISLSDSPSYKIYINGSSVSLSNSNSTKFSFVGSTTDPSGVTQPIWNKPRGTANPAAESSQAFNLTSSGNSLRTSITTDLIKYESGSVYASIIKGTGTNVNNYCPGGSTNSTDHTRVYNNNTIEFGVGSGYEITKIQITATGSTRLGGLDNRSNYDHTCTISTSGSTTTATFSSENRGQTVTANTTATGRLTAIVIYYDSVSQESLNAITGVSATITGEVGGDNWSVSNLVVTGTLSSSGSGQNVTSLVDFAINTSIPDQPSNNYPVSVTVSKKTGTPGSASDLTTTLTAVVTLNPFDSINLLDLTGYSNLSSSNTYYIGLSNKDFFAKNVVTSNISVTQTFAELMPITINKITGQNYYSISFVSDSTRYYIKYSGSSTGLSINTSEPNSNNGYWTISSNATGYYFTNVGNTGRSLAFSDAVSSITTASTIRNYSSPDSSILAYIFTAPTVSVDTIKIKTAPTTTVYTEGQTFNPSGLVITVNYTDGTSEDVSYASHSSDFSFTPNTSTALTTSNTSVTIGYGGKTTTQAITVNAKTVSSISITTAPTKTSYYVGDYFDPTGLVISVTYSDSSHESISYSGHAQSFTFNPTTSTALTTSNTSVTVTYGGQDASQTITVSPITEVSDFNFVINSGQLWQTGNNPSQVTYYAASTNQPQTLTISGVTSGATPTITYTVTKKSGDNNVTIGGGGTSWTLSPTSTAGTSVIEISVAAHNQSVPWKKEFTFRTINSTTAYSGKTYDVIPFVDEPTIASTDVIIYHKVDGSFKTVTSENIKDTNPVFKPVLNDGVYEWHIIYGRYKKLWSDYQLLTNPSDLQDGDKVIFVSTTIPVNANPEQEPDSSRGIAAPIANRLIEISDRRYYSNGNLTSTQEMHDNAGANTLSPVNSKLTESSISAIIGSSTNKCMTVSKSGDTFAFKFSDNHYLGWKTTGSQNRNYRDVDYSSTAQYFNLSKNIYSNEIDISKTINSKNKVLCLNTVVGSAGDNIEGLSCPVRYYQPTSVGEATTYFHLRIYYSREVWNDPAQQFVSDSISHSINEQNVNPVTNDSIRFDVVGSSSGVNLGASNIAVPKVADQTYSAVTSNNTFVPTTLPNTILAYIPNQSNSNYFGRLVVTKGVNNHQVPSVILGDGTQRNDAFSPYVSVGGGSVLTAGSYVFDINASNIIDVAYCGVDSTGKMLKLFDEDSNHVKTINYENINSSEFFIVAITSDKNCDQNVALNISTIDYEFDAEKMGLNNFVISNDSIPFAFSFENSHFSQIKLEKLSSQSYKGEAFKLSITQASGLVDLDIFNYNSNTYWISVGVASSGTPTGQAVEFGCYHYHKEI